MIYYSKIIRIPIVIMVSAAWICLRLAVNKRDNARKNGYPDGKKYKYIDIIPAFALLAVLFLSTYLSVAETPRTMFYDFISGFPALEHRIPYDYRTDNTQNNSDIPQPLNVGSEYFSLCRSSVNSDKNALYNPFLDMGIKLPHGWHIVDEQEYLAIYEYEPADEIIQGKTELLETLPYIPDYFLAKDTDNAYPDCIEVYIHNFAADPDVDEEYYKFNDNYAALNLSWMKSMGFDNAKALDDIVIGEHRYKAIYGHTVEDAVSIHRLMLSRIVDDKYAVNIDYICYSPSHDDMYDIEEYLFNSHTDPKLVESLLPEDIHADFVPVYSHIDGFMINEDGTVISSDGGSMNFNIPEGWEALGFEEGVSEESFILLSYEHSSLIAELVTAEDVDLSTETSLEVYAAAFTANTRKEKDIYSAEYIDLPFYADGYKFSAVKTVFREDKENNTYFFFTFPDKNQILTLIIDVSADTDISTVWDMFMN